MIITRKIKAYYKKLKNFLKKARRSIKSFRLKLSNGFMQLKDIRNNPLRRLPYHYQYACKKYSVDKSIVLIESFHGQNISDSGLEFAREILTSYGSQYTVYFASENPSLHQAYIDKIGLSVTLIDVTSKEYCRILATAGYIFCNTGLPIFFIKRKDQVYMQTWHGTPLKTLGKRMRKGLDSMFLAQHDFLQADYLTQPNEFTKDIIMNDYNIEALYTGKVVMAGYPRNRIFMVEGEAEKMRAKYGLTDKNVYVYMPTWRGTSARNKRIASYADDVSAIFKKLDTYLSDDDIFYVKFHPILRGKVALGHYRHILPFPDDVEPYPFLNCCDVLVTDYSSVFFDFSLTKKPIVLFIYDYEDYMASRGMNMDIRSLPFPQFYTTAELGTYLNSRAYKTQDYSQTDYFRTFFRYDSPDITHKLVELVLHGDESDLSIIDYAANRSKKWKVIKPASVRGRADLCTLSNVADENTIVWLKQDFFVNNPRLGEILHDEFNDSFQYIISRNVLPKTIGETIRNKLKVKKIRRRLHRRDQRRSLPRLKLKKRYIRTYGSLNVGCIPLPKDIVRGLLQDVYVSDNGLLTVKFTTTYTRPPEEAVILGPGNVVLSRRPLRDVERISGIVTYDIAEIARLTNLTSFTKCKPGVLMTNGYNHQKIVVLRYKMRKTPMPDGHALELGFGTVFRPYDFTFAVGEDDAAETLSFTATPFVSKPVGDLELRLERSERFLKDFLPGLTLTSFRLRGNTCLLRVRTNASMGERLVSACLRYRSKIENLAIPFGVAPVKSKKGAAYAFSCALFPEELKEIFWDPCASFNIYDRIVDAPVTCKSKKIKRQLNLLSIKCRLDENRILFPSLRKGRRMQFVYRPITEYDNMKIRGKELLALILVKLLGPVLRRRKIWIVYEKFSRTAQDNSFYFFKYCMEHVKDHRHIYYVIDPASPDRPNLEPYSRQVIPFMSLKHMLYGMTMSIAVSTDAISHFYVWRSMPSYVYNAIRREPKVMFLQHGVTAMKKVHTYFGRKGGSPMRYFLTTSQKEQEIVRRYFKYPVKDIPILGFARWDVLKDTARDDNRFILLMPTWRAWLENIANDIFLESDYYREYSAFLKDERLGALLDEKNLNLVLYLHPKFAEYISNFKDSISSRITCIAFGEQQLNDIIMACSLLITDYSSVCWDALYIDKPVIFYQFDLETYEAAHGSYIDMRTELPGPRTEDRQELIDLIRAVADQGYRLSPEYEALKSEYFAYIDDHNCERIYEFLKSQGL